MKKFILMLSFCLFPFSNIIYAQPYLEWVKLRIENETQNYLQSDIDTDSLGNIYFNGRTSNTSFQMDSLIVPYVCGYILGKLKPTNQVEWIKSINAAAWWLGFWTYNITATQNGNTYTDGYDIGSSIYTFADDTFMNNLSSGSNFGIYKHNPSGDELWCKQLLGVILKCYTSDLNENLVISASYSNNGFIDTIPVINNGNENCLLAKYDANGHILWAKSYGGSDYDVFYSLTCDNEGNIIGTGYYMSNDFVFGNDTLPPCSEKRGFVAKFSPHGDPLWFYSLGADVSIGRNVGVNSNNEIICAGAFLTNGVWFDSFALESPTNNSRYILKLSPEGEVLWAKCLYVDSSTFNQFVSFNFCDIDFDQENNIFIGGWNSGNLYFEGDTLLKYDSLYFKLPFVMKFTNNGQLEWFEAFHSKAIGQNELHGLSVSNDGTIVCAGWFSSDSLTIVDTTLYDPGANVNPTFIVKLKDKDTHKLPLAQGWSYISTYIKPDTSNMAGLFLPVSPHLKILKNSIGAVYWPQFNLNLIGNYNIKQGYQVCMNTSDTLEITGYRIRPWETPLWLDTTWQIIPYLRIAPAPLTNMLSPIITHVQIVKNGIGQVYWPIWNFNAIETMFPGQGYMIKMAIQDTLVYPKN